MFRQRKRTSDLGADDDNSTMGDWRKRRFATPLTLGQVAAVGFLWLVSLLFALKLFKSDDVASGRATKSTASYGSAMSNRATEVVSSVAGFCLPQMADRQGDYAAVARIRGCPSEDDAWLRFAQLLMPNARVFVDIGSNKGFTAARFFELWNPELGLDSGSLHKALRATSKEKELTECGACNDCMEVGVSLMPVLPRFCSRAAETTSDPNMARSLSKAVSGFCEEHARNFEPIRVFSFDGNPMMINGVTKARDHLTVTEIGVSSLSGVQGITEDRLPTNPKKRFLKRHWTLELAAFSDVYEHGKTVEFVLGIGEKGHLVSGENGKAEEPSEDRAIVPVLTVDHLMQREKLQHIDILKIDTEGHDPNVLRGAKKAIASHSVTLVIFEYNAVWEPQEKLGAVVEEIFAKRNYACYLEGKNLLLKLTHGCWSPKLEMRKWSNVWCVSLKTANGLSLATVFDSYSVAFL